jgi:cytochrome c biogenesis protein CcmG/thiol:disulfide interchange protein DsbE
VAASDLATYRGRWVVLNFFASWCPPCQQEEPNLVDLRLSAPGGRGRRSHRGGLRRHHGQRPAFDSSAGATWPAVVDPGGQIALRYGVRGPPETFLISPAGTVVAHIDGPSPFPDLDQHLAAARAAGP